MAEKLHEPVLTREVLDALDVQLSDTVVDATLGGAGHFTALLERLGEGGVIIGIDADPAAVERARAVYAEDRRTERPVAHLICDNFRNLSRILERLGIGSVDKVLFDLGWSGYQLAEGRGFSFQADEPLLMSYSDTGGKTAADVVNTYPEAQLAEILYTHGEERFARKIARAIVEARRKEHILTTGALVRAVQEGTPVWYHTRKTHPATKTFQALRIEVNDELAALREGLAAALDALSMGGRLAVITFHSIEDRIVKSVLRERAAVGLGTVISKKPVNPTHAEVLQNRRARSAKLRIFERGLSAGVPAAAESLLYCYA